jgi:hypothetical protein
VAFGGEARQLEADMARGKTKPLVEAVRVGARSIAGQLDQTAALDAGDLDRIAHEALADAKPAMGGGDPDPFDQAAFHTAARQARDDRQLQAADNRAGVFRDKQAVAALCHDLVEGPPIRGRQRVGDFLARPSERVVGQQRDDRRHILAARGPDGDGVCWLHERNCVLRDALSERSSR